MHVVVAAAPAVDAEAAGFQIREGPAEIAAAPIGLLGDFGGNFLCKVRIISKDNNARTLVPERQPAIVIRCSGFAWLDVYGARDGVGQKVLRRAGIDEYGGAGTGQKKGGNPQSGFYPGVPWGPHPGTRVILIKKFINPAG